jgi:hypothetical protein
MATSAEHEAELSTGLDSTERAQLIALLNRLAAEQGLPTGVHPGVAEDGRERKARSRRSSTPAEQG